MIIRQMAQAETCRSGEIDVSEDGDIVYRWIDGRVQATPEAWHRPRWDAEEVKRRIAAYTVEMERGGILLGAFDGDLLVGMAVLRYNLTDTLAQLVALFVSKDYRRRGVASGLTQEIARLAQANGARALYVSAVPSRSAVGFYTSQGFQPMQDVNPELYALEPEDIHMRLESLL